MGDAATPVLPDFTSQTAAAYKANIDAGFAVADRIAWAFAPHEQSTPDQTVRLEAGAIFDGATLTEVAAQSTAFIGAPTTDPRIDRVVIDRATGAVSVVTGTEAPSPVAPAITAGDVPVCQVALVVSQTEIVNADITDERQLNSLGEGALNIVDDATPQLGGTLDSNAHQVRWSKGADVASAAALSLGTDGNTFDITGTTTITSIGALAVGTVVKLHFDAALTLTHNATDLILPTGANITTAAGDEAEFVEYAAGDWRCTNYQRADGKGLVAVFSDSFTSAEQTIAIGTNDTVAHGLGALPKMVEVWLRCKTAQHGWAVGVEILAKRGSEEASVGPVGITIGMDTTNLIIVYSSNRIDIPVKTTGITGVITVGNWRAIARAFI